jgi:hypothetical protein
MTETERLAIEYVRSVKGGPTTSDFDEKHAPLGPMILPKLVNVGFVRVADDGRIHLTPKGSVEAFDASLKVW